VNSKYQNDLTYGLGTQTFGAGGAYSFSDKFQLNLGAAYTMYMKDSKTIDHKVSGIADPIQATESYSKSTFIIAIGVDLKF
jgi:hypothetical protein